MRADSVRRSMLPAVRRSNRWTKVCGSCLRPFRAEQRRTRKEVEARRLLTPAPAGRLVSSFPPYCRCRLKTRGPLCLAEGIGWRSECWLIGISRSISRVAALQSSTPPKPRSSPSWSWPIWLASLTKCQPPPCLLFLTPLRAAGPPPCHLSQFYTPLDAAGPRGQPASQARPLLAV